MAIENLEDKVRKNKKTREEVTDYLNSRKGSYMRSRCRKVLENRYLKLRASNDMQFGGQGPTSSPRSRFAGNNWRSNLAFPIVKERALIRDAIFAQNYRAPSLFSLSPIGATPKQNSQNMQDVLISNLRSTRFRQLCFSPVQGSAAKFGSAVTYTVWNTINKEAMRTVSGPLGPVRRKVEVQNSRNALNKPIHILDYFQNEHIPEAMLSDFQGHIENIKLSDLEAQVGFDPDNYLPCVKNVLEKAKKSSIEDPDKWKEHSDYNKFGIDRTVMYAQVNIKGNEDDLMHYYCELVGGELIRFQLNPHDDDLVPYAVFNYYKRPEYWWGNSDSEFVVPHENFTNLIMGMKADTAMRMLNQYILYGKGTIDPADWNNRHKMGGMVGVNLKHGKRLGDLIHQVQPIDSSMQSTDSIMREVKESQQRMTPQPDFSRAAAQGGLRNTTATAANILEEQGDVLEARILEYFNYGAEHLARINTTILQQRIGDQFLIRPKPEDAQRALFKEDILGEHEHKIDTSLTKNRASELLRKQNVLTMLMNMIGTQHPAFQNLNISEIVRDVVKDADVGDVDEIAPTQINGSQPGTVPDQNVPGMELGGAVQEIAPGQPQPEAPIAA